MYTTNDTNRLAGLSWDEFFHLVDNKQTPKQSVSLSVKSKCNEDVAMLPHKKATCYGFCAVTEIPKLVKCQSCGLVVKTVAFGHHQKIHHSLFCSPMRRSASSDSDSDDDCQGFLLSPPHHPTPAMPSDTMFDLKFVEETKRTVSDPLKPRPSIDALNEKNDNKLLRQSPPRYDVQRRNDLRLVLTKRHSSNTKPKTHKVCVGRNQTAPLVSISISRSNGPKRNYERNSTQKQTMNADKGEGIAAILLNVNEKRSKKAKWPDVQLTEDIFVADLEESEHSSIPLHHSPSESSDSETEVNVQQSTETGGEIPEESYLRSPHDLMREHCVETLPNENGSRWNSRSIGEQSSNSNNTMAVKLKMQQKNGMIRQQQKDGDRALQQSIVHKRPISKEKQQQTEKAPANSEMDGVVEKLFKTQGISVMALSPDGKRKLSIARQKNVSSNGRISEVVGFGNESRSEHVQFTNEKRNSSGQEEPIASSLGHRQHGTANASFHLKIPSQTFADERREHQKNGEILSTDSQSNGIFMRQLSAQRKTSASFAGVSWHKTASAVNCLPNVSKMSNANSQKGTLRFIPLNSASENVVERRQENIVTLSKKSENTTPVPETNSTISSPSPQKLTKEYANVTQPTDSDLQSAESVCHIRQNVHPSSVESTFSSVSFFGQNFNRKSNFIQQQKQIHQKPIVAKRFRPIVPRKRLYNADDEFDQFSAQPRSCAAEMLQHQQQTNLPCRPSNSQQNFDQRFHPKILSVFPPPPSVGSFGHSAPAFAEQIPGEFRTFGRRSHQLFSVKHQQQQQTHPMRQSRVKLSHFDSAFFDDSRLSKNFGLQIDGVHGPVGLVDQRIPSEYSHSQMTKAAAPCGAHLHQCQTYAASLGTSSAASCSSAFLFAASPPPHPPPSSAFGGPFPSVHHFSDSRPPPHQQHLLLHQQHFHPLSVLPAPQCRHNCARPSPPSAPPAMQGQFSMCRGGAIGGMASPHSEPFFLPPTYAFQQCQQQQIPHHFMRGEHQQQQRQNYVVTYDNEMDPEISAMEPPPVLEAEGNIPASVEEGGGTTRSDSDASDMDLREILPQQQK